MQSTLISIAQTASHLIPEPFKSFFQSGLNCVLNLRWPDNYQTMVVYPTCGLGPNEVFEAAEIYLRDKIDPSTKRLKVHKTRQQKIPSISIEDNIVILDTWRGIDVKWTHLTRDSKSERTPCINYFVLSFDKKFHHLVLKEYLPVVVEKAREIRISEKSLKLSSTVDRPSMMDRKGGRSIVMDHPSTFDTLVMDPVEKKKLIDDLETFTKRKEYYKKVGRAWKRGYLLYGPPGTGKSSLIAAMANHLKYDVHEFELTRFHRDSHFRETLLSTANRSIIVIEDIDCSSEKVQNGKLPIQDPEREPEWTLSGLLNFLDGLWSSCGDERIFVFTTNHKDRLDPALLRPGRIDVQIHMSYCTIDGIRLLAHKYLGVDNHHLFEEIKGLITNVKVTPAEVSGELMRSDDKDTALNGLINFLKRKKEEEEPPNEQNLMKEEQEEEESASRPLSQRVKRRKTTTRNTKAKSLKEKVNAFKS